MTVSVSMIAALARGRVIGTGAAIPWHLPRDIRHFREYTAGHHLLVGRRTFQEMDGWFSTQTPLVLTRQADRVPPGIAVVRSIPQAILHAARAGAHSLVVVGGASVYAQALPHADALVLTQIDLDCQGMVRFPDFETSGEWMLTEEIRFDADAENAHAMSFQRWRRIGRPNGVVCLANLRARASA